jgi:hypothetical protein
MERDSFEVRRYKRWRATFNQVLENGIGDSNIDYEELALKLAASDLADREDRKMKVREYIKELTPQNVKTQLITLCLDKNLSEEQAIRVQKHAIEIIMLANYKFMIEPSYRFEYFTKEGWNPHIHICIEKTQSEGKVAQALRRKFNCWESIYRVHVSTLNYEAHSKYINGEKTEIKEEYLKKDAEFKAKYNIKDYITKNWGVK